MRHASRAPDSSGGDSAWTDTMTAPIEWVRLEMACCIESVLFETQCRLRARLLRLRLTSQDSILASDR